MKLLTNFVVMALLFSTIINAQTGTTNIVPIIKQHHTTLIASGENSISSTVFSQTLDNGSVMSVQVTSTRDGSDFNDSFSLTTSYPFYNSYYYSYNVNFSFPDVPANNFDVITHTSSGLPFNEIELLYWDELIRHRYDGYINAEYPVLQVHDLQWQENVAMTLTANINLDFNYQDIFRIQYRTRLVDLYTPYPYTILEMSPADSESTIIDQQGWPVWVETWDLRPNLEISDFVVYNNNGPINPDNPAFVDSSLYAITTITENAGFWAGTTDISLLNNTDGIFYTTVTTELDSGSVYVDTSTIFTLSSGGNHIIRTLVDSNNLINETDSNDNEIIYSFNVFLMTDTPSVAINSLNYTDWNDVELVWMGSDMANDPIVYRYKLDNTEWTEWTTALSISYSNLPSGPHIFYVEVVDPDNLANSDSLNFMIDQPVVIADISDTTIIYGQTLEFDLQVAGGSEAYTYDAVYGTIDTNSHYSWTPTYSSNPYNESVTVYCTTWPNNSATDNFSVGVNLSDVVITGLDSNYVVLEEDILSDSDISASGGDNSSYNWTLTANTAGGDWLTLTSPSGAVTGFTGTAPIVGNAIVYDYDLSCTSLSQTVSINFTVSVSPVISFTVEPNYNFTHQYNATIQLAASGGDGNNYDWTVSDASLLTIDSTSENLVWLNANTDNMGTFQVNVSCSQSSLPSNNHTEQINFTVEQGLWAIEPMEIFFPTIQTEKTMVIHNINGSESMTYTLTLDGSSFTITSPLSGVLSAGESDTIQIINQENNTPYERTAQINININDGAYTPVVNLIIAASNTSLQAFSFNGGSSMNQELTIWNNTGSIQTVNLSNGNDVFSTSDTTVELAVGAFALININATEVDEIAHDTLNIVSTDINTQVLLQKNPTPVNSMIYDDGLPQGTIAQHDAIVNSFTVVDNDHLIGVEVFLRANNQAHNWIVLDDSFNELSSGECSNNYIGWQQVILTEQDQLPSGDYYIGVKAMSEEDNVYVGYDDGDEYMSYWYNDDNFELLSGTAFIRALTSGTVGIDNSENVPAYFALNQNYPNPFNPTTNIAYTLPIQTHVQLTIYSITGRIVAELVNQKQGVGNYTLTVNMDSYGLSSGMYFYRLYTPEFQDVKKLMFIK